MNIKKSLLVLSLIVSPLGASDARAQVEVPLIPVSKAAPLPTYMKGVNLQGAEYGPGPHGVFGTNYIYPTTQEFDYYKSKGFSTIRLPFDIARVQPATLNPLNQSELARITALVEYARQKGMYIILDPHNYGKMWSGSAKNYECIGTSSYIQNNYFADFWYRLSIVYKNYPNVMYGLMNEPIVQNPAHGNKGAFAQRARMLAQDHPVLSALIEIDRSAGGCRCQGGGFGQGHPSFCPRRPDVATVHNGAWRRAGNSPCIPLHDR